MTKPRASRRPRRRRARPLLIAAGAATIMSVAGCGGFHGSLPCQVDCGSGPTEDLSAEVPADLGVVDLAHESD